MEIVKFKEWKFEVDKLFTQQTYNEVLLSGSDACKCNECKNYVANRENIFSSEIKNLFLELGIDFRKEVEITTWETLSNGLHHIGGWFNFKGKIIAGKQCDVPLPSGGFTLELTKLNDNFSIGFSKRSSLTFFENNEDVIQIEFETSIPWIGDQKPEN